MHENIFYPTDSSVLKKLLEPKTREKNISAFILPHMNLSKCAFLYSDVLSRIDDGRDITVLMPLHREPLLKDDGFIWETGLKRIDTPIGFVELISGEFPASSYIEEEPQAEIMAVALSCLLPSSKVRMLWCYVDNRKKEDELCKFLTKYRESGSVIGVSSNLSRYGEDANEAKNEAISIIESDGRPKGACGAYLIESVTKIVPGKWEYIGGTDDIITAHGAFVRI